MDCKFSTLFVVRQVIKYSWRANKYFTFILIFIAVILGLFPFVNAYLYKKIIDYFVDNVDSLKFSIFGGFAAIFVLLRFLESSLNYIDSFLQVKLRDLVAPIIQYDFLNKVNKLPFSTFENHKLYDLINKTDQSIDWRPLHILRNVPNLITHSVSLVAALILTLTMAWWFAPIIILATLPQLLISNKVNALNYSISDVRSPVSRKYGYLTRLLSSDKEVKEVKLFGSFNRLWLNINNIFTGFRDQNLGMAKKKLWSDLFSEFLQIIGIGAAYIHIFYQTTLGRTSLGSLTFNLQVVDRLNSSTARLFYTISELNNDTLFLNPYFELLDLEEEKIEGNTLESSKFKTIEFKDVSFIYPNKEESVFKNLNLKIEKGEKIAIVGINGAGKTTLIKLLLRLYEPTSGKILIDGKDIAEINKKDWFHLFGVLFQDFSKYAFSVKENIEFGDPDKESDKLYIEAKEKSDAKEVIEGLELKDEQLITTQFEGGVSLSGGEWQRIALARMYYRDSEILILDEPTAAIDAISEAKIFENVQKLSENKTVIIISHRFSTVRRANRIIVLGDGGIIEEGDHNSLIKLDGKYAEMFNKQAEGYK
jgi:ATP-binding cassette subfamily B protein